MTKQNTMARKLKEGVIFSFGPVSLWFGCNSTMLHKSIGVRVFFRTLQFYKKRREMRLFIQQKKSLGKKA